MEIREVLALNLRKCRQAQGLSQEELAHRADIDRTYISAIERSVYAASIEVVERLAQGLGMEAADLLRDLLCELAGRNDDQCLNMSECRVNFFKRRYHERASFPGAILRASQNIAVR